MKELLIIGASGFGREVAWLVERINASTPTWNLLGFIDDDVDKLGQTIGGYLVLGAVNDIKKYHDTYCVCAVGSAKARKSIIERITFGNLRFATLIDPTVEMSGRVNIGEGSIICAHSIITVDVVVGKHVIVNLDCTIGHDAQIGDYTTLYPSVNVSGSVIIQECVELGTGTQIIQGKTIGKNAIVGAGAVVVRDIYEAGTYLGVPAKRNK